MRVTELLARWDRAGRHLLAQSHERFSTQLTRIEGEIEFITLWRSVPKKRRAALLARAREMKEES